MNTRSKAISPNTTADVPINTNASHTPAEPTREDAIPPWAVALMEKMEANNMKIDQLDMRLQKIESPKKSNSWEASSSQVKIPKELINDRPNSSNFVPYNDHYPRDRTDYQYNQIRVDIPMFKGSDDPKEFLNWESHLDS